MDGVKPLVDKPVVKHKDDRDSDETISTADLQKALIMSWNIAYKMCAKEYNSLKNQKSPMNNKEISAPCRSMDLKKNENLPSLEIHKEPNS